MPITEMGELPAPPDEVWAKLANPNTYSEWQATHAGLPEGAPESLSTGDTFKEKVTLMGMPGEITWTVEEADPPNKLVLKGLGPMGVTATMSYELQASDGGTEVTFGGGFEGAAIAAMQGPLEQSAAQAGKQSIEKLRAALGASPAEA